MINFDKIGNYSSIYVTSYNGVDYLYDSRVECHYIMNDGYNLNRNWSIPLLF